MNIPSEVEQILKKLEEAGFEAYVVGGCVRDLIMGMKPKDWDVTTNAKPEQIQTLFPESFYENEFGTVGVKTESVDPTLAVVEVTTYRMETGYSDKRRPDEVYFVSTLEEDLKRRDFTMNALALGLDYSRSTIDYSLIDPFGGQEDIKKKVIRAVGNAEERFTEDALRMLRAIRFASVLGFAIEPTTLAAIATLNANIKHISAERIRDELIKLIDGQYAHVAIELLRETGLLQYIIPELLEGYGVGQNLHHIYSVWEHNVRALQYSVEQNYSTEIRLASLLHDVGKPKSKRGDGYHSTFYGHDIIGGRMTEKIMTRLKFSKDMAEKVTKLVRYHLFYYNPGEVTETSVRRLVANIGKENVEDLLKVREADRIGSGVPKAVPYKLRHLKFMIDKVARDPISPKLLKMNGSDIMTLLAIEPGPRVGWIMNALMEEVLEDPTKNTREYLEERVRTLNQLSELELKKLSQQGKEKTSDIEEQEVSKIKSKHHVS